MKSFEWHSIVVTENSVEYKTANQKHFIRLDQVDGAEVSFTEYKLFLLAALISCLGFFSEEARVVSGFAVVLFVALYFATRKLTLQIHGGSMVIKRIITGKDFSEAEIFITNLKMVINEKNDGHVLYKKEA